jgi:hypothetical protein
MNIKKRVERLEEEEATRSRLARISVEDLTDEQLEEILKAFPYDLALLTDAELCALVDCYTDTGDYIPECMTPDLAARWEEVKR